MKIADMQRPVELQQYRNASHTGHHKRFLPTQANRQTYPDDDDITIIASNGTSLKTDDATTSTASFSDSSCNSATTQTECINITLGTNDGIANSGATGHFVLPHVQLRDEKLSKSRLNITLPDGETLHSTHDGFLHINGLLDEATLAHKVPGLAHSLLVSIKQLCNHG